MTVRIDSLGTEVVAEAPAERGTEDAREGMRWEEMERISALRLRLLRDALRTHAAGFDD